MKCVEIDGISDLENALEKEIEVQEEAPDGWEDFDPEGTEEAENGVLIVELAEVQVDCEEPADFPDEVVITGVDYWAWWETSEMSEAAHGTALHPAAVVHCTRKRILSPSSAIYEFSAEHGW